MLTLALRKFGARLPAGAHKAPRGCSSVVTLWFKAEHEGGGNGRSVATVRSVKGSVFKLKNITAGYTGVKASDLHVCVVCCVVFIRLLINSLFK